MIIKKFTGKTEFEATEAARAELGQGVVVMNVKKVKRKGLFGFLRPQLTEVTVALEEEPERGYSQENVDQVSPQVRQAVDAINQVVARTEKQAGAFSASPSEKSASGRSMNENLVKPERQSAKELSGAGEKDDKDRGTSGYTQPQTGNIERRLDNLQSLLEQQLTSKTEEPEEKKTKVAPEAQKEEKADGDMIRFMKLLYNTMLENEVNEEYANQVIDDMEKSTKPGMPIDYALAATYQKMILKFGQPSPITPAENGPKLVFFVGPTGVGKTTTIAKIASLFSVNEKKKVALLTTDTYRIAAAEQLRTYANILEIPFRIIYAIEEMDSALRDFKDYDYVLVDTAGHSHQNEGQRNLMKSFIYSVGEDVEKEVYLVLSATTKYRDLISIADTYSDMAEYKLIFTKLDETMTLGNLLNLRLHTGATISYVTDGQNVPDDIALFSPQKIVKLLLGGKH